MSIHKPNSPEFQFSYDSTLRTGTEPASLALLREQWMQALLLTAGAHMHMNVGREEVTMSVTLPRHAEPVPRSADSPDDPSSRPPTNIGRNESGLDHDVRVPLTVPSTLSRRFKSAAWRRQIRPRDLLQMFMEEFVGSGRMPSGKGVVQRGYGARSRR